MDCTESRVHTFVDCTNAGTKEKSLNCYNCVCGKLVLIANKPLIKLPLRKTDGARVLNSKKHFYKIIFDPKPVTVRILRAKGVEKQYRLKCKQCGLPVFYKHDIDSGVVFVFKNAVIGRDTVEVTGKKNKKAKKQRTKFFIDQRVKIEGIRLDNYKKNCKIIRQALEKQGKWERRETKSGKPCSSKSQL